MLANTKNTSKKHTIQNVVRLKEIIVGNLVMWLHQPSITFTYIP